MRDLFSLKNRKGHGTKVSKCYICLFICTSSIEIHLELVIELSTTCFKRFIARRGKTMYILGTNLIGVNHYLTDLHNFLSLNYEYISNQLVNDRTL